MKYGGNREFGACLCELAVHAFLIRSGFKVHSLRQNYRACRRTLEPLWNLCTPSKILTRE
jgi:hypothetical protein